MHWESLSGLFNRTDVELAAWFLLLPAWIITTFILCLTKSQGNNGILKYCCIALQKMSEKYNCSNIKPATIHYT